MTKHCRLPAFLSLRVALVLLAGCGSRLAPFVPPAPELENLAPSVSRQLSEHWKRAQANPRDASTVGTYGMTLQLYKQHAGAEACYRRAIEIEPKGFRWHFYMALNRHDSGRTAVAIEAIRGALKLDAKYAPAHVKLADWLLMGGDLRGAQAAAEEAVRLAPLSARAHIARGKTVEALEGVAKAVANFQKAVDFAREDSVAHYQLAMAYRKLGRLDEAQAEFVLHEKYRERVPEEDDPLAEKLQELHAGADTWIRLGKSRLAQGDLRNAERHFRRALELDRNSVLAQANLIAVYGVVGRWGEADTAYREAAAIDAGNWQVNFNFGILKMKQREYQRAEEALRLVVAANPKDADACVALAAALTKLGKTTEAEEYFKKALVLQPEHPLANGLWGEQVLRSGRAAAAIYPLLRAALVPDANTHHARNLLAAAYTKVGGPGKAAGIVKRALDRARRTAPPALVKAIEGEWTKLQQGQIPR